MVDIITFYNLQDLTWDVFHMSRRVVFQSLNILLFYSLWIYIVQMLILLCYNIPIVIKDLTKCPIHVRVKILEFSDINTHTRSYIPNSLNQTIMIPIRVLVLVYSVGLFSCFNLIYKMVYSSSVISMSLIVTQYNHVLYLDKVSFKSP